MHYNSNIGILMTVAWPLLAAIGIFFSAWTKPAFPKGQWFQFHRALMISSIIVSSIGLILVFVAHRNNIIPGIVNFDCVSLLNSTATLWFANNL